MTQDHRSTVQWALLRDVCERPTTPRCYGDPERITGKLLGSSTKPFLIERLNELRDGRVTRMLVLRETASAYPCRRLC